MNYCEWTKCGYYTGSGCKAFGIPIECKTKIEAEPYVDARLAARDKEWVEWAFVICRNPSHSSGYWTKGNKLMQHQPRCECAECWQERKKALEASNG